jgi:DNA-binding winged helix-turn-helix (wHTH) protein/tetratricopeptide (TPR) repeat protein
LISEKKPRTNMTSPDEYIYEFGPYRLDPAEQQLLRNRKAIPLPPKVFATLLVLVQNSGRVVAKDELLERVWPDSFVDESSLAQNISILRKALGEGPGVPKYTETVPKRGYRFVADVKIVGRSEGKLDSRQPIVQNGFDRVFGSSVSNKTVVVLPFRRLHPQVSDDGLLGLAMADSIITALNVLKQLTVLPTSVIFKYTNRKSDPSVIGRNLGAELVVDGTVQQAGECIRVTVQLIRVRGEIALWSGKFDAKLSDLFVLQDSISEQVAKVLVSIVGGIKQSYMKRRSTESVEAYQHYIKGRFFWDKRTEEDLRKSIQYFQSAIDLDPDYALAHAGMADSYSILAEYLFLPPADAFRKATAAAEHAVKVDYKLAEAHSSLAEVKFFYERDWVSAEEEFKLAIELDPNNAVTRHMYAWFLLTQEKLDEASEEFRRARELDPLSLVYSTTIGLPFYYKRQYNRAIKLYRDVLEMNPDYKIANYYLGSALLHKGDFSDARVAFRNAYKAEQLQQITALMGFTYAVMGKRDAAIKELKKLKALSKARYISPYNIALIYSGLGEVNEALGWLERAYKEGAAWLVFLKIDPGFDRLRSESRFTDLLTRVGFDS